MCVSPVSYLHYGQRSMMRRLVRYCMHVCCTTASTVCCACEFCIVFALLPAQCAVYVSPVLRSHYCQCSVLCV